MEESSLNQILGALEDHSKQINARIDKLETRVSGFETEINKRVDGFESKMNKRFDRLDAKFGGLRTEFTETQETVDYLASKNAQHESKLRKVNDM